MGLLERLIRKKAGEETRNFKGSVQVREYEKKIGLFSRGYGCDLQISAVDPDDFSVRLREARGALMAWRDARGELCNALELSVAADPGMQLEADALLQKLYHEDAEISPFLKRLDAAVTLCDRNGKEIMKYDWSGEAPPKPPTPRWKTS